MEQLISAATMPYIASAILFTLGTAFLGSILIFIVGGTENTKKELNNHRTVYSWNAHARFRILLQKHL